MSRKVLLVGSMPFANEQDAMKRALDAVGLQLFSLPDGEIGEKSERYPKGKRSAWIMTAVDRCVDDRENWQIITAGARNPDGLPMDVWSIPKLRPKYRPARMHDFVNFGYQEYFHQSYPIFRCLRDARGLPNLKFQVGVPTGLAIAFGMLSRVNGLRYTDAFNKRVAAEVNEIIKTAGNDVLIQIEAPFEMVMAHFLPKFLVALALRSILGLVKKIDPTARFGIHLCLGDLNHKDAFHVKTLEKMVHFSNTLTRNWPRTHRLDYVHYPFAEADIPPPLDPGFYAPLAHIALPEGTRFVAGFVHEKRTAQEHKQILDTIERLRGGSVDVACSCGLGRVAPAMAESLLSQMNTVAAM